MKQTEWQSIFGTNLFDLLKERNMTQRELARKSNLSISRINDYIKENAVPSIFAVINIAHALNVDVDELINFDEPIE